VLFSAESQTDLLLPMFSIFIEGNGAEMMEQIGLALGGEKHLVVAEFQVRIIYQFLRLPGWFPLPGMLGLVQFPATHP
jgi:hypothetical protein